MIIAMGKDNHNRREGGPIDSEECFHYVLTEIAKISGNGSVMKIYRGKSTSGHMVFLRNIKESTIPETE
jgi:hypothetical protein